MREVSAFSPGHITGFFQICDEPEDPLLKGSRGVGVSLSRGVITTVRVEPSPRTSLEIRINGRPEPRAVVSEYVLREMLSRTRGDYRVVVDHEVEIPMGAGMGSSGAGALSLALALNEALGLGLSEEEAAQVAHLAEVKCRTGLGTVIAETYGGLEVRVRAGAPGVGEVLKVPLRGDYVVACLSFGPIPTRSILTDEVYRRRINELGDMFITEFLQWPEPKTFMRYSRSFAEHVSLITERVRRVLREADEVGFTCSMPMFGEAVFSLLRREELGNLLEIFERHQAPTLILSGVDERGARLI